MRTDDFVRRRAQCIKVSSAGLELVALLSPLTPTSKLRIRERLEYRLARAFSARGLACVMRGGNFAESRSRLDSLSRGISLDWPARNSAIKPQILLLGMVLLQNGQ
jgi:hypothetical protein